MIRRSWTKNHPRFEAANPGIKGKFNPVPNVNNTPTLWEILKAGKAGDLITCSPCDDSLALFKAGHLAEITEMAGMEFPERHQSALANRSWVKNLLCPYGLSDTWFFNNKKIFNELGLRVLQTREQFLPFPIK